MSPNLPNLGARVAALAVVGIPCATGVVSGQPETTKPSAEPVRLLATSAAVTLDAYWEPIAASTYRLHERERELFDLKPAHKSKAYGIDDLRGFLPEQAVRVGDTWRVPRTVYGPLLAQLHPGVRTLGASVGMRVPGGYGCLRAVSSRFAEIVIRVHADFELRRGTGYFAPSQFTGSLFLDREHGAIVALALAVPPRDTNADILAGKGRGQMSADIVYVPRLELSGGDVPKDIAWEQQITLDKARATLARCFYRVVDIKWQPFEPAVAEARRAKKPLHVMVLFGTLDDESC